MYHFIFLSIILISIGGIAFIIYRKLPQIKNLDVVNLPDEKIYQKKKEIIDKKVDEHSERLKKYWSMLVVSPIIKIWGQLQLKFRIYVGRVERLWHHEQKKHPVEKIVEPSGEEVLEQDKKIKEMIQKAEQNLQLGQFERAEDLFISAIKIDPKNASAYRGLGDTYLGKGAIEEARETYNFVLKLESDDDSIMVKLADLADSQGDVEEAIRYYEQAILANDSFSPRFYKLGELLLKINKPEPAKEAVLNAVELEPKNPKYLDLLIEIGIILGNRKLAQDTLDELRAVNPENSKLEVFKERIKEMPM